MIPEDQSRLSEALRQQSSLRAVTIEVGSESHPTSSGSVQLTTLTGTYLNKNIFQRESLGDGFYRITFLLPIGNRYVVTVNGVPTPTGIDNRFQMIIEITEAPRELLLPAGLKHRFLRGNFTVLWANEAACVYFQLPQNISAPERRFQLNMEGTTPPAKRQSPKAD
jgi:hypothetical protein